MKITVICIDALRADSIGPRMRQFIDSGREYVNAYSAAPSTIPSVPTNLTGVPTSKHGLMTAGHTLKVKTIAQHLRARGFLSVGYSANNLANLPRGTFNEWHDLRWMSNFVRIGDPLESDPLTGGEMWNGHSRLKATQESYEEVWDDIENRDGDFFFYVHLMDVHEPFRRIPSVSLDDFPEDYRTFRLPGWINQRATEGKDPLTRKQWAKIRQLYDAEVKYLDDRLEFPGDLVIFMADHGQLLGEGERGAWLGHPSKFFLEESVRVPLGIKGLGSAGVKIERPFHLMYMLQLIENFLDGNPLPHGDTLYWEDFWYECATFAVKNPDAPIETLVMHSTGEIWYMSKKGIASHDLSDAPDDMIRRLAPRIVRATPSANLEAEEDAEIVKERLKGLGYLGI